MSDKTFKPATDQEIEEALKTLLEGDPNVKIQPRTVEEIEATLKSRFSEEEIRALIGFEHK